MRTATTSTWDKSPIEAPAARSSEKENTTELTDVAKPVASSVEEKIAGGSSAMTAWGFLDKRWHEILDYPSILIAVIWFAAIAIDIWMAIQNNDDGRLSTKTDFLTLFAQILVVLIGVLLAQLVVLLICRLSLLNKLLFIIVTVVVITAAVIGMCVLHTFLPDELPVSENQFQAIQKAK